jgi:hypothetical protein
MIKPSMLPATHKPAKTLVQHYNDYDEPLRSRKPRPPREISHTLISREDAVRLLLTKVS